MMKFDVLTHMGEERVLGASHDTAYSVARFVSYNWVSWWESVGLCIKTDSFQHRYKSNIILITSLLGFSIHKKNIQVKSVWFKF